MNLDFDLFISGSPNGDQRWPNNSEDSFSKQFFNLETDTKNACDFFIEIRTSPEGQRCCYYSYVHRKDVFGLVNGQKRKGAYFAMILRFKGIYCNNPRNIFSLMDMMYRNKVEGTIIEKTSSGESYLVESFIAKNDKLREIENLFTSHLSIIVNCLRPIDNTFASSQSGKIISYNLFEKDETVIIETLKKHLKVHLLAFSEDRSAIIDDYKTKLSTKEQDIADSKTMYANLLKDKEKIEKEYNDYKTQVHPTINGYLQRIGSLEQDNEALQQSNNQLREQLQETSKLPELHKWILEYAKKNHEGFSGERRVNKEENDESNENVLVSLLRKYWAYLVAILVTLCIIFLVYKIFFPPEGSRIGEAEIKKYEQQISDLTDEKIEMTAQLNSLEDSLRVSREKLSGIEQALQGGGAGAAIVPYNQILFLDITPISSGTITNRAFIKPIIKSSVSWKIKAGGEQYAERDRNTGELVVKEPGVIEIVLMSGNNEIVTRKVTLKQQQ
ncbi:MAG: hypothetical protein IJT74_01630 [Bacteroidales bacterium]|nr:hypothetical protein [Bacteroidales bacterium]